MKFSIIVPAYNAQHTLKHCLDSIFSSENKDFEVIVVDGKSADKSRQILKAFPVRLIPLGENKGAAYLRNIGSDNAKAEILVFIDSDVAIRKDTLDIIDESFKKEKDIVALTGLLSKECPHKDFFTQYKNLYMHYIFRRCPRYIDFLYGSLMAIKRSHFLRFNENIKATDDTELGQRYKGLDKKILLNSKLKVIHFKKYNFKNLIKNDFFVPFWWVKSFLLHKGYKDIIKNKRFSHTRIDQIMNIGVSFLLVVFLVFWKHKVAQSLFPIFLLLFFLLNFNFFAFLHREKGFVFSIKSILFTYLDLIIMGLGVLTGFIYFNGFARNR